MRVKLEILSASSLSAADLNGLSDPYAKFTWRKEKYRTSVVRKTLNPVWNETFLLEFEPNKDPDVLYLELFDWDRVSADDPLGAVAVNLKAILTLQPVHENKFPVESVAGQGGEGHVHIRLTNLSAVYPNPHMPRAQGVTNGPVPLGAGWGRLGNGPVNAIRPGLMGPAMPGQFGLGPPVPNQPVGPYGPGQFGPVPGQFGPAPGQYGPGPGQFGNNSYGGPTGPQMNLPAMSNENRPPDTKLEANVRRLKKIFPHEGEQKIRFVLDMFSGDLEPAIDFLLNEKLETAGDTPSPASPSDTLTHVPLSPSTNAITPQQTFHGFLAAQSSSPFVHSRPSTPTTAPTGPGADGNAVVFECRGRRKALLIGINYVGTNAELRGCINDVRKMKSVLTRVYGFADTPEAIVCLLDTEDDPRYRPTRSNIIYGMRWLVEGAQPGDCFFFHFSGHGTQMRNESGTEEDGMDEIILPEDYKTAGGISDDEISAALVHPLPSGCRLTSVMDCCHSGTGMDLPYLLSNKGGLKWETEYCPYYSAGDVQLFSGCMDSQTSSDLAGTSPIASFFTGSGGSTAGGAMTTAFVSAVLNEPFNLTYPQLLERIRDSIQARGLSQRPQLTSTQPFPIQRNFNLTDATPNMNPVLGPAYDLAEQKRRRRKKNECADLNMDVLSMFNNDILGIAVANIGQALFKAFF